MRYSTDGSSGWAVVWPVACRRFVPAGPLAVEDPSKALLIVELSQRRMLQRQIARNVGVSEPTVAGARAR
ncbi:hypothetical protein CBM2609_P280005 [Cupriavidus taiwanensis]|uniref:Uncharacterized protein n=2 Tax=Cupriavidus TaxID=106589 RepID=A0A375DAM2_9BURK|nr:hypothetical protein CBM2591_P310005 [Cupriavidus taiwanensis]SOZ40561.1 hypothetical protein CBM2605_P280005 [Cupriavidus neocaledonicus]SOZ02396.1 hypothetical protein CBM2600_P300005 [Cupriavidus taiwanensis]SOZ16432.1 hypothetical protein CBM2597_P240004 [Cupriavidus taiwanensis]SOZ21492.1 hypothetical protein CBM2604_P290005 [Cupriavidus taiwanensis]